MISRLVDFWIRPQFRNYDAVNIVFYAVTLCLGALVGSLVSVFVVSTAVYGTLHLLTGRLRWAGPNPVKMVAFGFLGLFAADALSAAVNPSMVSLDEVAENLPFLGFAGIYSITFLDRLKLLRAVEMTALAAPLAALALLLVWFADASRPGLAAGNAGVLALLGGVLYVVTIGAAFRRMDRLSLVFLVAAAASACVVVLTGTRAMWPVLVLAPFIGLLSFGSRRMIFWGLPAIVLTVNCLVIFAFLASPTIRDRVQALRTDIHAAVLGDLSGSLGQRIQIYRAGYELYFERPILGYGPGNERSEIAEKTAEIGGQAFAYSHAHNALLNAALRSGLVGVVALLAVLVLPFAAVFRAKKDEVGWAGFHTMTGILAVYVCSGTTGLMLGHDIHDSVYIAGTCYALYLVFGRTRKEDGDPRR